MKGAWWLAVAAELAYVVVRFYINDAFTTSTARELALTAWRLVLVAFYAFLFRDALRAAATNRRLPKGGAIVVAMLLLLLIPLVVPKPLAFDLSRDAVFAATTPIVAVREEIFYRLILLGGLRIVMGSGGAIAISTALFLVYHVGAQATTPVNVSSIVAAGVLLGVLYERTRNLWLVVALHTLVDWLWLLPAAYVIAPVPVVGLCIAIVVLAAWWHSRDRRRSADPSRVPSE